MSSLRAASFALLGGALALGSEARANGRFPAAQQVWIGPGTASSTIALRTTFGFAISDDNGATFRFACEQSLNYRDSFDPSFVLDSRGGLVVGVPDGLSTLSTSRCAYAPVADLMGRFVIDVDASRDGRVLVAAQSNFAVANQVYRSDDSGATWRALGAGVQDLPATLELAPSNPQRLWLSGKPFYPDDAGARLPTLHRSDDGGATLVPVSGPWYQFLDLYIAAVDPTDADTLYLRGVLNLPCADPTRTTNCQPTALLQTTDGGRSWRELTRTQGPMLGFALSDDGRTLWIGGPNSADGLLRSTDRGASWTRIGTQQVLCLRQHAGALYVCANFVVDGYALGRSMDQGATVQPVLRRFDEILPPQCSPESPEVAACRQQWPLLRASFSTDAGVDAASFDAAGADGPVSERPGTTQPSCSCRAPAGSRGSSSCAVGLSLLASLGLRRRRR